MAPDTRWQGGYQSWDNEVVVRRQRHILRPQTSHNAQSDSNRSKHRDGNHCAQQVARLVLGQVHPWGRWAEIARCDSTRHGVWEKEKNRFKKHRSERQQQRLN
jgi:hypothetical protein